MGTKRLDWRVVFARRRVYCAMLGLWSACAILAACSHDNRPAAASDAGVGDSGGHDGENNDGPHDTAGLDAGGGDTGTLAQDGLVFADLADNTPPTLQWLAPAAGMVVQVGSSVAFLATVQDDHTSPVDLGLALTWTDGPALDPIVLAAEASGTIGFSLVVPQTGKRTLLLTATDPQGASSQASLTVLVNTAPGAAVVAIVPSAPTTSDELKAQLLQPAWDPDSGALPAEKHQFQWLRDGVPQSDLKTDVVPADRTKAGDTWTVIVQGADDSAVGPQASATVTVVNSAPEPATVVLQPAQAHVGSTVTCSVSGPAQDADGDPVQYLVQWTLAGQDLPQAGTATTLVLAEDVQGVWTALVPTHTGDVLACHVVATDGNATAPTVQASQILAAFDPCVAGGGGCPAHSVCTPTDTVAAACPCAPGYSGPGGLACSDMDECALGLAQCPTATTCQNSDGGFTCQCAAGFVAGPTDSTSCVDVDECATGAAQCDLPAACSNTVGGYACVCPTGYLSSGAPAGGCYDIDECAVDLDDCDLAAECSNTVGAWSCSCKPGYAGSGQQCADLDECTLGSAVCDVHAACSNLAGAYQCLCSEGYSGDGKMCEDLDECALGLFTCATEATCANLDGSYLCKCDPGYVGDGAQCADQDECSAGLADCASPATCTNLAGTYACACQTGWQGDGHGTAGCQDVDECAMGQFVCASEAACQNVDGSYQCLCNAGYVGDGKECLDQDECANGTAACDPAAVCLNSDGGYACQCKDGWVGDGKTCKPAPPQ